MSLSNDEILNAISQKSVIEIVELVKAMEDKFGVSAAAAVAAAPAAQAAAAEEEKTEFNVVMTSFGANKIEVIKVIRAITGLGLKEAKDMVEGVPSPVKEGISKDESEDIKKKLQEAGASVDIK
jgi:large subunit ribosomal protein L7/L12